MSRQTIQRMDVCRRNVDVLTELGEKRKWRKAIENWWAGWDLNPDPSWLVPADQKGYPGETGGAEPQWAPLAARCRLGNDSKNLLGPLDQLAVQHQGLAFLQLYRFPILHDHLTVHHDPRTIRHGRLAIHPANFLPILQSPHLTILHRDAILLDGHRG